ncbi:LLM class flavin-dependent oxidoreductase, partial [Rathayibacter festucae]|uniref:LLM class flavin-dependent oxidoreductase n=1 Tax=Rathayibacter festucae TaxID=110937 RepID=UPI002A6A103F
PSPQRTPFLFQAGSSPAGRAFAARHAEAQFVGGSTTEQTRELIASTRALTEAAGRRGDDVLFFSPLSVIVGSTEREAREREAELDAHTSVDAHLLHAGLSVD